MEISRSIRAVVVRGCYIRGVPYAEDALVDLTPGEFGLLQSFGQVALAPEPPAPAPPAPAPAADRPSSKSRTRSEA